MISALIAEETRRVISRSFITMRFSKYYHYLVWTHTIVKLFFLIMNKHEIIFIDAYLNSYLRVWYSCRWIRIFVLLPRKCYSGSINYHQQKKTTFTIGMLNAVPKFYKCYYRVITKLSESKKTNFYSGRRFLIWIHVPKHNKFFESSFMFAQMNFLENHVFQWI